MPIPPLQQITKESYASCEAGSILSQYDTLIEMERKQKQRHHRRGFSILDTVLGLFVLSTLILVYASLVSAHEINRRVLYRAQAAALADEEINALKRWGFKNLPDQTNGDFHNILYNAGDWKIVTGGVTGNALELAKNTASPSSDSGRLQFPAGSYDTGTIQAAWQLKSDSPTNSAFGYIFQAQDNQNYYRLRIARTTTDLDTVDGGVQNMVLEKVVNGTASLLFAKQATINTDQWYTLKLVLDVDPNPTIDIYLDGSQQIVSPIITDTTFTSGPAALLSWGGAHVLVDDAQTITTSTENWDFDGQSDLPAAWTRLGLNDLPDSTPNTFDDNGKLTIEAYPAGATTLKKATVTVQWRYNAQLIEYTSTVLIGKSEVGL